MWSACGILLSNGVGVTRWLPPVPQLAAPNAQRHQTCAARMDAMGAGGVRCVAKRVFFLCVRCALVTSAWKLALSRLSPHGTKSRRSCMTC